MALLISFFCLETNLTDLTDFDLAVKTEGINEICQICPNLLFRKKNRWLCWYPFFWMETNLPDLTDFDLAAKTEGINEICQICPNLLFWKKNRWHC